MDALAQVFARHKNAVSGIADIAESSFTLAREIATHHEEETASWSAWRLKCRAFLSHSLFESITTGIIVLNVILVIFETDARAAGADTARLDQASKAFLAIFTTELVVKFYVYRFAFFGTLWNWLDFGVVLLDLAALGLSMLIEMPSFVVLRVLRVARAFKAAKKFGELARLLRGFMGAIRAIFWGILMISMLLIVWGIMAVNILHPINQRLVERNPDIYDGCARCARAYASVFDAMLTMFQQVVAGDSWGMVSLQIIEEKSVTGLFFLGVLITVNLVMLNLILSVIIEAAVNAAVGDELNHAEELNKAQAKAASRLIELCEAIDADGSGKLSKAEFFDGYADIPEFQHCLRVMGAMPDDLDILYNICDLDGSGDVNYIEFAHQLRRMRHQGVQMMLFYVSKVLKLLRVESEKADEKAGTAPADLGDPPLKSSSDRAEEAAPLDKQQQHLTLTALKPGCAGSEVKEIIMAESAWQAAQIPFGSCSESITGKYPEAKIEPFKSQELLQSLEFCLSLARSMNDASSVERLGFAKRGQSGHDGSLDGSTEGRTPRKLNAESRGARMARDSPSRVDTSGDYDPSGAAISPTKGRL
eukprot:TRINITY_DN7722_c1_g1_i1.p1 TRINITY_DN7722_c1_g1~~TRINITY_DN7722_c1_g1_i1.p1  ORF type:complete len:624 (-),score=128.30 TRINITY_DN7722_c1_g1_i1:550-2322(-)